MIPIVSDRYKYILFYNPKSACSVARQIFLKLHRDELGAKQLARLAELKDSNQDEWHELGQLFSLDPDKDYSNYFKFTLVRHPATRLVSAYLNRVVLNETDHQEIADFFMAQYGNSVEVSYSFQQFLEYLDKASIKNTHFLPQSVLMGVFEGYLISSPYFNAASIFTKLKKRLFRQVVHPVLNLNQVCKVESLTEDLLGVYQHIFSDHADRLAIVKNALADLPMHNVTYSNNVLCENAVDLSAKELRGINSMPSYASFINSSSLEFIERKFKQDFRLFGYSLNLDAGTLAFEKQKSERLSEIVPAGFDWQQYLAVNADLPLNGIDTQAKAISHWIHHGRFENRQY